MTRLSHNHSHTHSQESLGCRITFTDMKRWSTSIVKRKQSVTERCVHCNLLLFKNRKYVYLYAQTMTGDYKMKYWE